jgi:MscS family membrane protein
MNDFFEQVWWGNPVKNYFIVFGVLLFIWLLKRFISRYFAGLLFTLVHRIWNNIDKKSFVNLVVKPLGLFLAVLISIVALYKLNFPAEINADVYKYTVKEIVHCIGTAVLIISFIGLFIRIIDFVALILEKRANFTADQSDNQLIVFFKDFFKIILVIIGIMLVLRYAFYLNIGGLLTGLSIVGAAIALALRESLENLIASFIIFFDKPFVTGDLVKVQHVTGTVEKIGLRSTRIRTDQKTFVTVPNKQMVDTILDNLSLRTQRRGDLKIEIETSTTPAVIEQFITGIDKILSSKKFENYHVHLAEITKNAIVILADYYTAPVSIEEFNNLVQEINLKTLRLIEELKIEIAGVDRDIRIIRQD